MLSCGHEGAEAEREVLPAVRLRDDLDEYEVTGARLAPLANIELGDYASSIAADKNVRAPVRW